MVLICPQCDARLQLDEAKAPSRPFTVRCPKCQTAVNVEAAPAGENAPPESVAQTPSTTPPMSQFERPAVAQVFKPDGDDSDPAVNNDNAPAGLDGIAKLLAEALR